VRLVPAFLVLAATLVASPAARAGSLDDDAPGWRKPRYDRPIYVPRREREPLPQSFSGASLVPPMVNTYDPFKRDLRGRGFGRDDHGFGHHGRGFGHHDHGFGSHRGGATAIGIDRHPGGQGGRPPMVGGPRR
jgi:hypothetical protein